MALVTTDEQNYSSIASAVRSQNMKSKTYLPSEMAAAINSLVSVTNWASAASRSEFTYDNSSGSMSGKINESIHFTANTNARYFIVVAEYTTMKSSGFSDAYHLVSVYDKNLTRVYNDSTTGMMINATKSAATVTVAISAPVPSSGNKGKLIVYAIKGTA